MADSPARNTLRLKIKKTVEDAVPALSIDVTKILTDEETAELHHQMEQRCAALDLADQIGRAGLKARFKRSVIKRAYDPMVDGPIKD